jgi:LPXTG-site transpeptidase (sortase) family protein
MEPPRRFTKFLSALFLAIGTLLLLVVAGTWYQAERETAVWQEKPAGITALSNLPPALAPAAPTGDPSEPDGDPAAGPNSVEKETAEQVFLLPESLIQDAPLATAGSAAVSSPPGADSRPLRIVIPALAIDAPVFPAELQTHQEGQRLYQQWSVPNAYAAGWHETSAPLGEIGNTVLNGHNNVHGAIFADLGELPVGEQILLVGADEIMVYRVAHHELLQEKGLPLRERLQNARWIAPTEDQRLTLVTCWPNTTNSHRLIVVALPEGEV